MPLIERTDRIGCRILHVSWPCALGSPVKLTRDTPSMATQGGPISGLGFPPQRSCHVRCIAFHQGWGSPGHRKRGPLGSTCFLLCVTDRGYRAQMTCWSCTGFLWLPGDTYVGVWLREFRYRPQNCVECGDLRITDWQASGKTKISLVFGALHCLLWPSHSFRAEAFSKYFPRLSKATQDLHFTEKSHSEVDQTRGQVTISTKG